MGFYTIRWVSKKENSTDNIIKFEQTHITDQNIPNSLSLNEVRAFAKTLSKNTNFDGIYHLYNEHNWLIYIYHKGKEEAINAHHVRCI